MEEILKALLGGASDNSGQQQTNSNQVIIDLLGQVLGGGSAPQAQPASPVQPNQQEANPMADLIGQLIGGGSQQAGGNAIADLLGGILGGGSSSNPQTINPIAQLLVDKIGLSPALAQAVVSFFMAKMIEIVSQQFTGTQPALPQGAASQPGSGGVTLDLDNLLSNVHDEQNLNLQLSSSGLPQELASQTGLDEETATQSLQELVKSVAQQRQPSQAPPQSSGLDNLLDSWETE